MVSFISTTPRSMIFCRDLLLLEQFSRRWIIFRLKLRLNSLPNLYFDIYSYWSCFYFVFYSVNPLPYTFTLQPKYMLFCLIFFKVFTYLIWTFFSSSFFYFLSFYSDGWRYRIYFSSLPNLMFLFYYFFCDRKVGFFDKLGCDCALFFKFSIYLAKVYIYHTDHLSIYEHHFFIVSFLFWSILVRTEICSNAYSFMLPIFMDFCF